MRKNLSTQCFILASGVVIATSELLSTAMAAPVGAGEAPVARRFEPAEAAGLDAKAYAADHHVTLKEAARRLRAEEAMSVIVDPLKKAVGDRLAGLWIEHDPELRMVVRLVGSEPAEKGLLSAVANTPIPVVFQTGAAASQAELLGKIHSSLADLKAVMPEISGTDVDVKTGEIVLMVFTEKARRQEKMDLLPELKLKLGAPVRIEFRDSLARNLDVRGGANLSDCTSGFVVANSGGTRGFATAAHCGNTESYSDFDGTTTSTTFQSEIFDADQDFQWHTTPLAEVPQFYADLTTSARILTGKRLRSSTAVGNTVCHRGKSSGYSCGSVDSTTYQPTFSGACGSVACASVYIRVNGPSLACAGGDSGGPCFNGQTAFGLLKGGNTTGSGAGQCTDMFYMSTDSLSGISLVFGP